MKNFLCIDETLPVLEQSFKAETKLNHELPTDMQMKTVPLVKLSSLAEDIHIKTREVSQYIDLDMQEFVGSIKPCSSYRIS